MDFVVASANSLEDIQRAVRINAARGLSQPMWRMRHGSISVCGNGPSLRETFPSGGPVAALNGAWRALAKTPDFIIVHDPSPENVAWFKDAPDEPLYLLASQVHPDVFEALAGKRVRIWHLDDTFEREMGLEPRFQAGFTIGCYALHVLNTMGYTHFDCYGYDSCYSLTGEHHATSQPWRIGTPQPYQVGAQMFIAEPWMAAQVQEFLKQVEANRYNYTVDVKGDGMLAAALYHNTLEVLYDLNFAPGSFDFLCAMVNIENARKQHSFSRVHVNFKAGKNQGFRPTDIIELTHAYKKLMLNNVARPLLEMFAFQEVPAVADTASQFQYLPRESLDLYRETGQMAEYRPNRAAVSWAERQFSDRPFVITLREAEHHPGRNSKVEEWIRFARTLPGRVIFVRDTAKAHEPIDGFETCPEASVDVHKRMALYGMARMNFSVCTGPIMLAAFTRTIPYLYLLTPAPGYTPYDRAWQKEAIGLYGQYPWHDPATQRVEYADDTFEEISRVYHSMGLQEVVA